jgi:peptidyl-prolyl cis-trans isomerase C
MILKKHTIGNVLVVFLIAGCQSSNSTTVTESAIVAMVDDEVITLNEFQESFKALHGDIAHDNGDEARTFRKNLLDQIIDHRLLIAEAERLNITVDPQELRKSMDQIKGAYSDLDFEKLVADQQISLEDWKDKLRQQILVEKLTEKVIDREIEITDQEIEDYFRVHRDNFKQDEMVRARQIVVGTHEQAVKIRDLILNGSDFMEIAATHSLSPDRFEGGDLGFFTKGEMPEEFDVVFDMNTGEISPIIQTGYGYHLFRVEEYQPSRDLNLKEAKDEIREDLTQRKRNIRFMRYINTLRQKAQIKINSSILFSSQFRNPIV